MLVVDDVELVLGGSLVVGASLVVGTSLELVELLVGTTVDVDVLVTASHVQTGEHTSPGSHAKAPPGELGSHGSPGSTMPFPHVPGVVVVVVDVDDVVDDDVVDEVDDVVVVGGPLVDVVDDVSQVHTDEHTSPGAHVNAPVGELGSQGSPGSTTPFPQRFGPVVLVVEELVVDEVLVDELVVETGSHVHVGEHTSPGSHVNAPVGELGSQGSPGSTMPFPHSPAAVVVVVDDEVVVVEVAPLHSGGYGTNSGTARRSMQSTLNSVTQSTHWTMSWTSTIARLQLLPAGMVTPGHVDGNPMSLGDRSSPPPHTLSGPPHALQIFSTFFDSASWIAGIALPSPGSGHRFECLPFKRASQHFCSAFDFACRNFVVSLPIAR